MVLSDNMISNVTVQLVNYTEFDVRCNVFEIRAGLARCRSGRCDVQLLHLAYLTDKQLLTAR